MRVSNEAEKSSKKILKILKKFGVIRLLMTLRKVVLVTWWEQKPLI